MIRNKTKEKIKALRKKMLIEKQVDNFDIKLVDDNYICCLRKGIFKIHFSIIKYAKIDSSILEYLFNDAFVKFEKTCR